MTKKVNQKQERWDIWRKIKRWASWPGEMRHFGSQPQAGKHQDEAIRKGPLQSVEEGVRLAPVETTGDNPVNSGNVPSSATRGVQTTRPWGGAAGRLCSWAQGVGEAKGIAREEPSPTEVKARRNQACPTPALQRNQERSHGQIKSEATGKQWVF